MNKIRSILEKNKLKQQKGCASSKEMSDKKEKHKTWILYICTFFFFVYIVLYLFFQYFGYFNMITKDCAIDLVNGLESEYIYQEVFETDDYKKYKEELLDERIVSKKDYYDFLKNVRMLANDKFSFFIYDALFVGNELFHNAYSNNANSDDDFEYKSINNKFGYIAFKSFKRESSVVSATSLDFIKAVKEFKEKNIDYLVIDLRENGGGAASEMETIADSLLPETEIYEKVYLKRRIFTYSDKEFYNFKKIFVFMDKESASCSEVLALTLKENLKDKVVIMGQDSVMKAVWQDVMPNKFFRFKYYVVAFKWYVYGKDVYTLKSYMQHYKKDEMDTDEEWLNLVNQYIN